VSSCFFLLVFALFFALFFLFFLSVFPSVLLSTDGRMAVMIENFVCGISVSMGWFFWLCPHCLRLQAVVCIASPFSCVRVLSL